MGNYEAKPTVVKTVEKTRERSSRSGPITVNPYLVFVVSMLCLAAAGYMAFGPGINSLAQAVVFSVSAAIGFGGFTSAVRGSASITLGKWFKATGVFAVLIFALIAFLRVMGALDINTIDRSGELVAPDKVVAYVVSDIGPCLRT